MPFNVKNAGIKKMNKLQTSYYEYFPKKVCKVCSPNAEPPCRLSTTVCPYRDIDTKEHQELK